MLMSEGFSMSIRLLRVPQVDANIPDDQRGGTHKNNIDCSTTTYSGSKYCPNVLLFRRDELTVDQVNYVK